MDKDLIIQLQQEQLAAQTKLIAEWRTMIKLFKARIDMLENNQKKDSSNSSKPPSSDIGRPQHTKSLHTKSAKKPGGQHGHKGETLCFSASLNEIVVHAVKRCQYLQLLTSIARRRFFNYPTIGNAIIKLYSTNLER